MPDRSSFFNAFNSEFEKQLPLQKDYRSAFQAASSKFEEQIGQAPYKTLNSFKVQRSKRHRKS